MPLVSLSKLFSPRFAALILNRPVPESSQERLVRLWDLAEVRLAVDGGANHWYDIAVRKKESLVHPIPDMVTGDFDSIRPEVLNFYRSCSDICRVVDTPDQNDTDFTKALVELSKLSKGKFDRALVFIENTGRLDQIFANVQTLYQAPNILGCDIPVFLVSSDTLTWLLQPGETIITLDPSVVDTRQSHVGLIPVGSPLKGVKTRGLKWDLSGDEELAFGKLVSTSNAFAGDSEVSVSTPNHLLMTMEIK